MTEIENTISNLSYTNKDFQSIYEEILNAVSSSSYKWNPVTSNESDPGVVLLKELAIIADKNNYNIDKNVLENFPLSVTQSHNARNLFDQLGYKMKWYESAVGNVVLKYDPTDVSKYETVTIPKFTMVCDDDTSIVYTLVSDELIPQDIILDGSGRESTTVKCLQGVVSDLIVSSSDIITSDMLDSNNRVYFQSFNVAQNGIFISNYNSDGIVNYSEWKMVSNISSQKLGTKCYEFGVDRGNHCYIEFPEDITNLIGNGLTIKYLASQGLSGNSYAGFVSRLYSETSARTDVEGESVTLTSDNMVVRNSSQCVGGRDPETIDEAYDAYKKVKGTFDTVVSLRDYCNYLQSSSLESNGFVTDRTNDVQSAFTVISNKDGRSTKVTEVVSGNHNLMDAFDLKLYALQAVDVYGNMSANNYDTTFMLIDNFSDIKSASISAIEDYVADSKTVCHDFVELDEDRICFIKNKFPITVTVIPQYKLSAEQTEEVTSNIRSALYNSLNASKVVFGEEILYDKVYDLILGADDRIKSISLDRFEYDTYAVYKNSSTGLVEEVKISDAMPNQISCQVIKAYKSSEPTYVLLNNSGHKFSMDEAVRYSSANTYGYGDVVVYRPNIPGSEDFLYVYVDSRDSRSSPDSTISWKRLAEIEDADRDSSYFDYYTGKSYRFSRSEEADGTVTYGEVERDYATEFKNEIYVKAILAGVTPLFIEDGKYSFSTEQIYSGSYSDVAYVSTNTSIDVKNIGDTEYKGQTLLRSNESICLYAPNYIDDTQYSNYVKCLYSFGSSVPANGIYTLGADEYIVFYYKASESDSAYTYIGYGSGTVISSTVTLSAHSSSSVTLGSATIPLSNYTGSGTVQSGEINLALSNLMSSTSSGAMVLSGSSAVAIKKTNSTELYSDKYCYFVLNNKVGDRSVLFDSVPSGGSKSYVLKENEFFMYMNSSLTESEILMSGTKIEFKNNSSSSKSVMCKNTGSSLSVAENPSSLKDYAIKVPGDCVISVTEMQKVTVNPGDYLRISSTEWEQQSIQTDEILNQDNLMTIDGSGVTPGSLNMAPVSGAMVVNNTYSTGYSWKEDSTYATTHFVGGRVVTGYEIEGSSADPDTVGIEPGDGTEGTYMFAYNPKYSTGDTSWVAEDDKDKELPEDTSHVKWKVKWVEDAEYIAAGVKADSVYGLGSVLTDYTYGGFTMPNAVSFMEQFKYSSENMPEMVDALEYHVYFPNIVNSSTGTKLPASVSATKVYLNDDGEELTASLAEEEGIAWLSNEGSSPESYDMGDYSKAVNPIYSDNYYVWLSDPIAYTGYGSNIQVEGYTPYDAELTPTKNAHAYNKQYGQLMTWEDVISDGEGEAIYDENTSYSEGMTVIYNSIAWVCTSTSSVRGQTPSISSTVWSPAIYDGNGELIDKSLLERYQEDMSGKQISDGTVSIGTYCYCSYINRNREQEYKICVATVSYVAHSWTAFLVGSNSPIEVGKLSTKSWVKSTYYEPKSWTATLGSTRMLFTAGEVGFHLRFKNDGIYKVTESSTGTATVETEEKIDKLIDNDRVYKVYIGVNSGTELNPSITWSELESISGDGWEGHSLLDFTATTSTPMTLMEKQSIKLYNSSREHIATVMGHDEVRDSKSTYINKYVLADYDYNLEGGEYLDVIRGTLTDEVCATLYTYDTNTNKYYSSSDIEINSGDAKDIVFNLPISANKYSVNVKLFTGLGLHCLYLPIYHLDTYSDVVDYLKSNAEDVGFEPLLPVNRNEFIVGDNKVDFSVTKNSDGVEPKFLAIRLRNRGSVVTNVSLQSLIRYKSADAVSGSYDTILRKMSLLDKDNKFDYFYSVDDDVIVENPLSGDSFFDVDHPYNAFTIGQIYTNEIVGDGIPYSEIYVSNKVK